MASIEPTTVVRWHTTLLVRGVLCVGVFACGLGCASRGNVELLEAQLRQQEDLIQSYKTQLSTTQDELVRVRREVDVLRASIAESNGTAPPQELTEALASATSLTIHPLLSGGQDRDGLPGDEVLHAVIYPSDQQGGQVKLAGALEIEAIELSGETRRLGKWSFPISEARDLWHSGFLSSGYQVEVPWEVAPSNAQVLVRATLKTPDGRVLDGSQTVKIVPPVESGEARPVPKMDDQYPSESLGITPPRQQANAVPRNPLHDEGFPQIPPQPRELVPFKNDAPLPKQGVPSSDRWTDDTLPQWR